MFYINASSTRIKKIITHQLIESYYIIRGLLGGLIFAPIFLTVVVALEIDPLHFDVVLALNLYIDLCTPTVGIILFVGSVITKV
jgi:TRAP-type C4-dicarboxylate transport system permease large subunit